MEEAIRVFKALSDPHRIRIVKLLEMQPLCVCEITSILGLATSTVSKHLSILKEAGLIFDQKEHRWVNYHLNRATRQPHVQAMIAYLSEQFGQDPVIREDRERVKRVSREAICRR